jgi:hypothetical protein
VTQGNNQADQKVKQAALQPLDACQPLSLLSFTYRSLYILNVLLMRKKRLHREEDIEKEIGGT